MVIASDGVWELLNSQDVADIVHSVEQRKPGEIAELILEKSSHEWQVEEGDYRDDIMIVVLKFPWLDAATSSSS